MTVATLAEIATAPPPAEIATAPPPAEIPKAPPPAEILTVPPPAEILTVPAPVEIPTVPPPTEIPTVPKPTEILTISQPAETPTVPSPVEISPVSPTQPIASSSDGVATEGRLGYQQIPTIPVACGSAMLPESDTEQTTLANYSTKTQAGLACTDDVTKAIASEPDVEMDISVVPAEFADESKIKHQ